MASRIHTRCAIEGRVVVAGRVCVCVRKPSCSIDNGDEASSRIMLSILPPCRCRCVRSCVRVRVRS